jgi:hypothetical protein
MLLLLTLMYLNINFNWKCWVIVGPKLPEPPVIQTPVSGFPRDGCVGYYSKEKMNGLMFLAGVGIMEGIEGEIGKR